MRVCSRELGSEAQSNQSMGYQNPTGNHCQTLFDVSRVAKCIDSAFGWEGFLMAARWTMPFHTCAPRLTEYLYLAQPKEYSYAPYSLGLR